ncbi:MAG: SpoIIE family protein phosphatase [Erysipelotrichaceae bacterium]
MTNKNPTYFIDHAFSSLHKHGEELCGDRVMCVHQNEYSVIVLADGLGSGVKANILATLTSKIISTMVAGGLTVEDCVETIAQTLPVCQVRKIAYSTFSILKLHQDSTAYVAQFDSPSIVILRDGKVWEPPFIRRTIGSKEVFEATFTVESFDTFVMMSDGVIHAGLGNILNFGWQLPQVVHFLEQTYQENLSAKAMSTSLVARCEQLYGGHMGDDTTVSISRMMPVKLVNILIGPPSKAEDDFVVVKKFLSSPGKHIVSGGTTSNIVAQYLNKPVVLQMESMNGQVPPTGALEGIDLVSEGVITYNRVMEHLALLVEESHLDTSWLTKKDGVSQITRMLVEEATHVNFMVGCAKNPAHQNPLMSIDLSVKLQIVKTIAQYLEKLGKIVKVEYY